MNIDKIYWLKIAKADTFTDLFFYHHNYHQIEIGKSMNRSTVIPDNSEHVDADLQIIWSQNSSKSRKQQENIFNQIWPRK